MASGKCDADLFISELVASKRASWVLEATSHLVDTENGQTLFSRTAPVQLSEKTNALFLELLSRVEEELSQSLFGTTVHSNEEGDSVPIGLSEYLGEKSI